MRSGDRILPEKKILAGILFLILLTAVMGMRIQNQPAEEAMNRETMQAGEQKEENKEKEEHIRTDGTFSQTENLYRELYQCCKDEESWVELYVLKVLSRSIDTSYEAETLKAQAVILRSRLWAGKQSDRASAWSETKSSETITGNEGVKKGSEDSMIRMLQAVLDTRGIVMQKDGEIFCMSYHAMSSGMTRTHLDSGRQGVSCPGNLAAKDYMTKVKIRKEKTGTLGEARRDEQGYVEWIERNGVWVSGEKFRVEFGLPSANFTWEQDKGKYCFTVKGIGHGFGFDQYYANELAKNGDDFQEILHYFDDEITFERIE